MKQILSRITCLTILCFLWWSLTLAQTPVVKGRALLVGINYYQDARISRTSGAVEDAEKLRQFIQLKYGFSSDSIRVLTNQQATAANIKKHIQEWLIDGTRPGERIFFSYSGHGSQLPNPTDRKQYESTLAPFDVNPETGANMIGKSEIKQLVSQMSGRMAVLLFDSCHSGTITRGNAMSATRGSSRYLPRPDQFVSLSQSATLSEQAASANASDKNSRQRALVVRPMLEQQEINALSGLVVICAAGPDQQAFSMPVGGEERGALSYLFEETQRTSPLTLRELKTALANRIVELQRSGQLEGEQTPWFDITTQVPLEDKPLFGTWESIPAAALLNPTANIKLLLRSLDRKSSYHIGEKVTYQVTTDTPGYLYLLAFSQQNVATCIFPNKDALDNKVGIGTHKFPHADHYIFPIQPPEGRDVVIALLAKEPLDIGIREVNQNGTGAEFIYTWQQVFDRLPFSGLAERVSSSNKRGLKVSSAGKSLDSASWQGASLVIETLPAAK